MLRTTSGVSSAEEQEQTSRGVGVGAGKVAHMREEGKGVDVTMAMESLEDGRKGEDTPVCSCRAFGLSTELDGGSVMNQESQTLESQGDTENARK